MIYKYPRLGLLLVGALVAVLTGTRFLCEVTSPERIDACCSGATNDREHEATSESTETDHGADHHDPGTPLNPPDSEKPDFCCSIWYLFTFESAKLASGAPVSPHRTPALDAATPSPAPSGVPLAVLGMIGWDGNNRAPNRPLFLVTHSILI